VPPRQYPLPVCVSGHTCGSVDILLHWPTGLKRVSYTAVRFRGMADMSS
jgi:hypothetical protein